jgi:hypothetical protein
LGITYKKRPLPDTQQTCVPVPVRLNKVNFDFVLYSEKSIPFFCGVADPVHFELDPNDLLRKDLDLDPAEKKQPITSTTS